MILLWLIMKLQVVNFVALPLLIGKILRCRLMANVEMLLSCRWVYVVLLTCDDWCWLKVVKWWFYIIWSNILFIIHPIILFDISPFCWNDVLYGIVQVIRNEGYIPSLVRVGVVALIRNTRGDEGMFSLLLVFIMLLDF